jgi:hypothetical protein
VAVFGHWVGTRLQIVGTVGVFVITTGGGHFPGTAGHSVDTRLHRVGNVGVLVATTHRGHFVDCLGQTVAAGGQAVFCCGHEVDFGCAVGGAITHLGHRVAALGHCVAWIGISVHRCPMHGGHVVTTTGHAV